MRKINEAGLAIIKKFEGCKLQAYLCPASVVTIGWGSTGSHVKMGMKITQAEADALLLRDLEKFEKGVAGLVKVEISDNEFSALCSLSFNIGLGALKSSTLLRLLNEGKHRDAAVEFSKWDKSSGKVLPGLTKRRTAERELFLKKG